MEETIPLHLFVSKEQFRIFPDDFWKESYPDFFHVTRPVHQEIPCKGNKNPKDVGHPIIDTGDMQQER